ncbi:hypothetical protein GCM10022223_01240 [Kineosporia mesophila]|uniref:Uncharacterized protein n=1 Tax=Kineosporia mesophila TaxID=566012 RepID=A0ABP6YXM9_9ACTN
MGRPRHGVPEIEQVLQDAEARNWPVEYNKNNNIWRLMCPMCGKHIKWVHKTPSNPRYALNLRKWLERTGCWKEKVS